MKERGISFSGDMVRVLLAGSKTQTRRVIKPQPNKNGFWRQNTTAKCDDCGELFRRAPKKCQCGCTLFKSVEYPISKCLGNCPYGVTGDRLWVRESYCTDEEGQQCVVFYKATDHPSCGQPWKSPRYMPKEFARITLEITRVRVERVQDISEADAIAEGCRVGVGAGNWRNARHRYQDLWDSLYEKPHQWADNPWIWCLSFKVV